MAHADYVKALIRSIVEKDIAGFKTVAKQIAAHEESVGHTNIARDITAILEKLKESCVSGLSYSADSNNSSIQRTNLSGLLNESSPDIGLNQIILHANTAAKISRILQEQEFASELLSHGLSPRRKLLLVGPPGTGKTMTASVLACELNLPLFEVNLDVLVSKYLGETSAKLRQIFNFINEHKGVYLFDEFDAIGSQRGSEHDVGEIRRIVNSLLKMIEADRSNSIIIGSTNHPNILDYALLRRFDDLIRYELPNKEEILSLFKNSLKDYSTKSISWSRVSDTAVGLNYADIKIIINDIIKLSILRKQALIREADIKQMISERSSMYNHFLNIIPEA